jgi:hypothetical protein
VTPKTPKVPKAPKTLKLTNIKTLIGFNKFDDLVKETDC